MRKSKGFTLTEILIVVAIIAIIGAIAYPAYQESVRKARRADAKAGLLNTAQMLERCFTEFSVYNDTTNCNIIDDNGGNPDINLTTEDDRLNGDGYYTITDVAGTLTATTYTIRATPTGLGAQDKDTACASFELTNTGKKESNAAGDDDAGCW